MLLLVDGQVVSLGDVLPHLHVHCICELKVSEIVLTSHKTKLKNETWLTLEEN